jgi:membrane-bound ClpP family serine protease
LIREYENHVNCRLIVMIDVIYYDSVTFLEELLYDCSPNEDLHLMINSPGGVGEVAVRLARSAQSRCRELTIIVPDQAKSAATLLAVGGHQIIMAPAGDLGPVDPQFFHGRGWVAAKDIIAAVEDALQRVEQSPATYPVHVSLLGDVTAVMVQQARSALGSTEDMLREALRSNPDREDHEIQQLVDALRGPLIEVPQSHAALFGANDAERAGLKVKSAETDSPQWKMLWRLWTKYFDLGIL